MRWKPHKVNRLRGSPAPVVVGVGGGFVPRACEHLPSLRSSRKRSPVFRECGRTCPGGGSDREGRLLSFPHADGYAASAACKGGAKRTFPLSVDGTAGRRFLRLIASSVFPTCGRNCPEVQYIHSSAREVLPCMRTNAAVARVVTCEGVSVFDGDTV